jgi:hypothetical protein
MEAAGFAKPCMESGKVPSIQALSESINSLASGSDRPPDGGYQPTWRGGRGPDVAPRGDLPPSAPLERYLPCIPAVARKSW